MNALSLWALFWCFICLSDGMSARNKICYKAKTCIHSGIEKCGVDGQGNLRKFFDSCDLLEFNCLQGTDYVKTQRQNCDDLPPINGDTFKDNDNKDDHSHPDLYRPDKESSGNEYGYKGNEKTQHRHEDEDHVKQNEEQTDQEGRIFNPDYQQVVGVDEKEPSNKKNQEKATKSVLKNAPWIYDFGLGKK